MIGAGILGGTGNFALTRTEQSGWKDWWWAVVVGIVASLLVPLFLNTISSNLLINLLKPDFEPSIPFIFGGFCLLGAISSKALIQTLTQKLMQGLKATEKKVAELETVSDILAGEKTEPDENEGEPSRLSVAFSDKRMPVLKALMHPRFALRSVSGIARELNLDRGEVLSDLKALAESGLVAEVHREGKGIRWALTPAGREKLTPDAEPPVDAGGSPLSG
jgi:DNA-binding transcriptional ArsR family regulator